MVRRALAIIAVVIFVVTASISTAMATKKGGSFAVTASNTAPCEVTATATWHGADVSEVDFTLHVAGQTYQSLDSLKKTHRSGKEKVIINTENAGSATLNASFLGPDNTEAGTATSSAFTVNCP